MQSQQSHATFCFNKWFSWKWIGAFSMESMSVIWPFWFRIYAIPCVVPFPPMRPLQILLCMNWIISNSFMLYAVFSNMVLKHSCTVVFRFPESKLRKKYILFRCRELRDTSAADGKSPPPPLKRTSQRSLIFRLFLISFVHSGAFCCRSTSSTDTGMDAFLAADKGRQSTLQLKGPKGLVGFLMWMLAVGRDESFQARAGWPCWPLPRLPPDVVLPDSGLQRSSKSQSDATTHGRSSQVLRNISLPTVGSWPYMQRGGWGGGVAGGTGQQV